MLKKICSLVLVVLMIMSVSCTAFAEVFFIGNFEETPLAAQKIVIANGHAFVAEGKDPEAPDIINIYNLSTKELKASLTYQIYETGKGYCVENMYVVGEYMYVSWNRHKGSGNPSVRKYKLEDMLAGKLESVYGPGVRGDKVTCLYGNKLFYQDPKVKILYYISTDEDKYTTVMSLSDVEQKVLEYELVAMCADENYFYMIFPNEIRVYPTENMYNGLLQSYSETTAIYNTQTAIKDAVLHEEKLYIMNENGLEVFAVEENEVKSLGKHVISGELEGFTPAGKTAYAYSALKKNIQILDITNPANIAIVDEVELNNPESLGIADFATDGQRIYVADKTDGFAMYSSNKLDLIETEQKAQSYAEELMLSDNAKAIEVIVGLGIMNLRDEGLFYPDSYMTRGEFANAASKLLGDKANGTYAVREFKDVSTGSVNAEAINALANIGILNGFSDGTFRPDEPIVYEHALKIIVNLLGYSPYLTYNKSTPFEIASDLGLTENVKALGDNNISRAATARLFYNALETETIKFSSGVQLLEYTKSGKTLLEEIGLKRAKGRVTATEFTSVLGLAPSGKGKVTINGTEHSKGKSGAGSYLGRIVTYYYKSDEYEQNGEVVFVMTASGDDAITVAAEDISPETTKSEFCYLNENYDVEKESIKNASIIYNGKFLAKYNAEDLMPADGEVTLLDGDNDGETDTVIVTSYETYVAEAYGRGIFKFKYGKGELDLNKIDRDGMKAAVTVDGYRYENISSVTGVKEWTVLSVLRSRDDDIVEIYATNNCIPAMVTKVEGNKKVWLDDTEYEMSKSFADASENTELVMQRAVIGDDVYAYTDKFGKVAALQDNNLDAMYGYLVACNRGEGLNSDKVQFKMLVRDPNELFGSMQIFDGAEKVKINGKKVEDIYSVGELYDENGIKEQLVKFVLNQDGKVKDLYTAKDMVSTDSPYYDASYPGYDEFNFTYDAKIGKSNAYRSMGTFEGEPFTLNNATLLFMIPSGENPADEDYKMMDAKAMFYAGGTTLTHDAHIYDVSADYIISAMVFKTESSFNPDAVKTTKNIAVVDHFEWGLNEDGEEKMMLITAKDADGISSSLSLSDENLTDATGAIASNKYLGMKICDLPKGSVLQYVKNGYGDVAAVRILHIPSQTKTYFEFGLPRISESYLALTFYAGFGKVSKLTSAGRVIYNAGGMEENGQLETADRKWDRNLNISSAAKYLYDSSTNKISSIETTDILPGDDILIVLQNSGVKCAVVYR